MIVKGWVNNNFQNQEYVLEVFKIKEACAKDSTEVVVVPAAVWAEIKDTLKAVRYIGSVHRALAMMGGE